MEDIEYCPDCNDYVVPELYDEEDGDLGCPMCGSDCIPSDELNEYWNNRRTDAMEDF